MVSSAAVSQCGIPLHNACIDRKEPRTYKQSATTLSLQTTHYVIGKPSYILEQIFQFIKHYFASLLL